MENTNNNDRIIMPESANSGSAPDWSIGDLYSRSWQIIKKYKVLWIFGMFALAGGGFNSNFSRAFNSSDSSLPSSSPLPSNLPNINLPEDSNNLLNMRDVPNVLDDSTSNILGSLFGNINPGIWGLIGIELLALIIIGWILVIIKNAYATSALLSAAEDAIDDKPVSIEKASLNALPKIKPMAWVQVIPSLILGLGSFALLGIPALLMLLGGSALKVIGGILIVPALIVVAFFTIRIILTSIWAVRIVVTENISGRDAFWKAMRIQKKKKWSMIGLGLVNNILGGIIFGIPLIIVVGIVIALVAVPLMAGEPNFSALAVLIPIAVILIVVLMILFSVGSGIFNAFKAVVWSLAYRKIKGKYENE